MSSICCKPYRLVASDCASFLVLEDKSGNTFVINLFGATVRYINGTDGLHIQGLNAGIKVDLTDVFTDITYELIEDKICAAHASSGGGGGGVDPATPANTVIDYIKISNAGTVAAGKYAVSISNVGDAVGTVEGGNLPVGASVAFNGYLDPVSNTFYRLPSVSYDATGTSFIIAITD
jgi:hypothetical protein